MTARARAISVASSIALLLSCAAPLAPQAPAPAIGRVQGVVYDSLRGGPLAGAIVQIVESPPESHSYSTTTDSLGRFRLDGVDAGDYIAGFLHPVLDSLGVNAPYRALAVRQGAEVPLALAVPSAAQLTRAICGQGAAAPSANGRGPADSTGMIVGHVHGAGTGAPVPGSEVTLEWATLVFGAGGAHTEAQSRRVTTSGEGWFAICGLSDDDYRLHAEHGASATALIDVAMHPQEIVRISLLLGAPAAPSLAGADSAARGGATLTGTVTAQDGQPLAGAQVVVDGAATATVTDARGAFSLNGLPDGSRMAEAHALGYEPVRVRVEPSRSERRTVAIAMATRVPTLDAVTVYGKSGTRMRDFTGFLDRKRRGFGRFITREEIDRRSAVSTCDLLRRVPGLHVFDDGTFGCTANLRGSTTGGAAAVSAVPGLCEPTVYEDNMVFGGTLSEFARTVPPHDIMGIEVYTTATEPPQFAGACGAIVVWTRLGA